PLGEWEAIRRLRSLILRYGGWRVYGALNLFYLYRTLLGRHRLGFCDALICGSRWSVGMWRREGVPAEAIHALPYPIDLERFTPEGPGARTPGVTTFLWLGRIVPRKRFDLLLDAYRLVRRERTDVRLRIFGSIAYPRGYQTLIEGIGPEEGIAYQPTIATEQVPELLRSVDVLVQPSENENLGSSVTEALSCGTPVIVGPTNGTRDYISPSSLVLEAYTPEALKRAMLCMIDRLRSDADRIRAEARATAEEQVAPAVVACRLCALLAEVRARAQRRGVRH
ncbi:MAG: glycosyltransferase family 4 protein, partial [Isosphaeraceae bacterium]|nr:glycosyltransferase family 4 protein [Isosphaeraceae bacterium]